MLWIEHRGDAAFSLEDIPGMEFWVDAADTATITGSGNDINQWADKSGNAHHLLSGLNKPETNVRTQNGLNAVNFIAVNADALATTSAFWYSLVTSTMFCVAKVDIEPVSPFIGTLVYESNGSNALPEYGLRFGTQYPNAVYVTDASVVKCNINETSVDITTSGVAHLFRMTDSGTEIKLHTDSGAGVTQSSITSATTTLNRFVVGNIGNPNGPRNLDGYICEVLVWDSVLSSGDIADVETYLTDKWGL
jgi:hypothetical protein